MARGKKAAVDLPGEPGKYGTVGTVTELYKRLIMAGTMTDDEIAAAVPKGKVAFVRMYRSKLAAAGLKPPPAR